MATQPAKSTSTATKVVVGTGVGALLLGMLGAFSKKSTSTTGKSGLGCGKCGR